MLNTTISSLIESEESTIRSVAFRAFQRAGFDRDFSEEYAHDVVVRVLIKAAGSSEVSEYLGSAFEEGTRKSTRARFIGWLKLVTLRESQKIGELAANKARRYHDSVNTNGMLDAGGEDNAESAGGDSLPLGTIADPRTLLLRKEESERLDAAIATLEEWERDIVKALAAGLPQVEIAEYFGMSTVQVTRTKKRIFSKIRAELAE